MMHPPKTRAEAQRLTYGSSLWGKLKFDPARCAYEVASGSRAPQYFQCSRAPGHGPDKLYCAQHDPASKAARAAKQQRVYDERMERLLRPGYERDVAIRLLKACRPHISALSVTDEDPAVTKLAREVEKFLKSVR